MMKNWLKWMFYKLFQKHLKIKKNKVIYNIKCAIKKTFKFNLVLYL
jgi:hypothetical protein